MKTVHHRVTGKLVFMLIELFSLVVTAKALRVNNEGGWSVLAKFSHSRRHPLQLIFAWIDRPMNALQLCC